MTSYLHHDEKNEVEKDQKGEEITIGLRHPDINLYMFYYYETEQKKA